MNTQEIAGLLGGTLHGEGNIEITSVADIHKAKQGEIAFYEGSGDIPETEASCLIVRRLPALEAGTSRVGRVSLISVENPKLAFARIASVLHPPKLRMPAVHSSAVISDSASIGKDVFVGPFACVGENSSIGNGTQIFAGAKIGDNVTIGENCVVHATVTIEDRCTLGNNVTLHSGVVIGADGFGYVKDENGEYVQFPQIGTVVIEDHVEIGANTCVDRGALGETRIGAGTKIDNLVQVGHNVQIGKRCVIAAQTGISGSVIIEDNCVIGGQVGFGDHVRVQSGAIIGSQAGVLPGKIVRPGVWWGTPIQPLDEFKRQNAHVKSLERLKAQVKELAGKLAEIESRDR